MRLNIIDTGREIRNRYLGNFSRELKTDFEYVLTQIKYVNLFREGHQLGVGDYVHIDVQNIFQEEDMYFSNIQAQIGPGQGSTFAHVILPETLNNVVISSHQIRIRNAVRIALRKSSFTHTTMRIIVYT